MIWGPSLGGRLANGYAELNTGTWWEETQHQYPGKIIMPLIFYLDGVALTKTNRKSIKPITMTVGNLKLADQNKDKNKKLIAYMPDLGGTKTQRETKKYKHAKNRIYHEALESILKTVKVCYFERNNIFLSRVVKCLDGSKCWRRYASSSLGPRNCITNIVFIC